jgi:hypothetical protein
VGAGAPDCLKFSERLFKFPSIGALRDEKDAMAAIVNPAKQEGFESAAVQQILTVTERYPLFAAVGARSLEHCQQKFYSSKDVLEAHNSAISVLDESFFKVRFDRCTASEKSTCARLRTSEVDRIVRETLRTC